MASAQQKKKQTSGERNDSRPNGKAPKKSPKPQHVLSPEEKAEATRISAERRVAAAAHREAEAKVRMLRIHQTALRMNEKFDQAAKVRAADEARKVAAEAAKKVAASLRKVSA